MLSRTISRIIFSWTENADWYFLPSVTLICLKCLSCVLCLVVDVKLKTQKDPSQVSDENVVSLIRKYDRERKNVIVALKSIWPDFWFFIKSRRVPFMLFVSLYENFSIIFCDFQNSAENWTPCNRKDNIRKFTASKKSSTVNKVGQSCLLVVFSNYTIPSIIYQSPNCVS